MVSCPCNTCFWYAVVLAVRNTSLGSASWCISYRQHSSVSKTRLHGQQATVSIFVVIIVASKWLVVIWDCEVSMLSVCRSRCCSRARHIPNLPLNGDYILLLCLLIMFSCVFFYHWFILMKWRHIQVCHQLQLVGIYWNYSFCLLTGLCRQALTVYCFKCVICSIKLCLLCSVDAKDLDVLLAEITILNTRTELYLRFLRRRILVSLTLLSCASDYCPD